MRRPSVPGGGVWLGYLSWLADLRLTLEQNTLDYQFGLDGGRIVYLFDANVVRLFLNPVTERVHVPGFGRGGRDDRTATAMITAEFLFSRKLSGQEGLPPYLTQAHAEDLSIVIERLEREVLDRGSDPRPAGEPHVGSAAARDVGSIVELAQARGLDHREAVRSLSDVVPELAASLFDGALYEARQLRRLFDEDMLRPLRLMSWATAEVLVPDRRIVEAWAILLREELGRSTAYPGQGGTGHLEHRRSRPRSIMRDAETLAQLDVLNGGAREGGRPIKYVLVTTDRVMRRAYAKRFLDGRGRSRAEYALRHPSQYVPILNAEQMGNGATDPDLLGQVRDAIDGLFQALGKEGQDYMRALEAIVGRHAPAGDGAAGDGDAEIEILRRARKRMGGKAFRRVQARWAEAARGAILLNAPVLRKHFDSGWDAVSAIVENEGGIRHGVLEYIDDLLLDVEASHAGFLVNGFLDRHAGPSAAAVRDAGRPRLLLRPWSPELRRVLDATGIDELWRALRGRGRGPARRDAMPAQTDHTTLLVAACVAFRVGQWGSAGHFSNRAADIVKAALFHATGDDREALLQVRHELHYLEAEIARHGGSAEDRLRCRRQLGDSLDFYQRRRDGFGIVRTYCGLSGLGMADILSGEPAGASRPPFPPAAGLLDFIGAADDAKRGLGHMRDLRADADDPLSRNLAGETFLGYFVAAIYDIRFARTGSFEPDAVAAACEAAFKGWGFDGPSTPPMLALSLECARWAIGDGAARVAGAGRIRSALRTASGVASRPADRWLVNRIAHRIATDGD